MSSRISPSPLTEDASLAHEQELAPLEADVAEVLGAGHGVEVRLVEGGRRRALVRASEEADLLVVAQPLRGSGAG